MPWDHFCAACGTLLEGGMADGDEMDREMKAFDNRVQGKLIKCSSCGAIYDFDSHEVKEVVEL